MRLIILASIRQRKNTQLVEISMQLLTTMINLLVPVPYFLPTLQNLVEKFLDTSENYGNMVNDLSKLESQLIALTNRLSRIAHPYDPLN